MTDFSYEWLMTSRDVATPPLDDVTHERIQRMISECLAKGLLHPDHVGSVRAWRNPDGTVTVDLFSVSFVLTAEVSIECPCGRARAGCEYHDPALQPAAVQHGGCPEADVVEDYLERLAEMYRGDPMTDHSFEVVMLDAVSNVVVKGAVSF